MGNVSTNVYAKFRCALLRIKKALVIFRELITTTKTRTTRMAFWELPSGSKNLVLQWNLRSTKRPAIQKCSVKSLKLSTIFFHQRPPCWLHTFTGYCTVYRLFNVISLSFVYTSNLLHRLVSVIQES